MLKVLNVQKPIYMVFKKNSGHIDWKYKSKCDLGHVLLEIVVKS